MRIIIACASRNTKPFMVDLRCSEPAMSESVCQLRFRLSLITLAPGVARIFVPRRLDRDCSRAAEGRHLKVTLSGDRRMKVSAKELRTRTRELLECVARGEEVTVTYRGKARA